MHLVVAALHFVHVLLPPGWSSEQFESVKVGTGADSLQHHRTVTVSTS